MKKLVLICGPQAAGKSTCIATLNEFVKNLYPCMAAHKDLVLFCLQEARQIIVHKYHTMGAIFLTPEQEREIIATDLGRLKVIFEELDESLVYVDESNVFTLAHAKAHGIDLIDEFLPQYLEYLIKLKAVIIFLDLDPSISWQRRKEVYEARLYRFEANLRKDIYTRYRQYLFGLYPNLLEIFDKLPLQKVKISADLNHHQVMQKILTFLFEKEII